MNHINWSLHTPDRIFTVPEHMRPAIVAYIEQHQRPGEFLTAVICNDLREAVGRADDRNIGELPAYVNAFYNYAPSACWGSPEKMEAWLAAGENLNPQDGHPGH